MIHRWRLFNSLPTKSVCFFRTQSWELQWHTTIACSIILAYIWQYCYQNGTSALQYSLWRHLNSEPPWTPTSEVAASKRIYSIISSLCAIVWYYCSALYTVYCGKLYSSSPCVAIYINTIILFVDRCTRHVLEPSPISQIVLPKFLQR